MTGVGGTHRSNGASRGLLTAQPSPGAGGADSQYALSEVERAVQDRRALVVVVTDDALTDRLGEAARRVGDLREAGCVVVQLVWSSTDPDASHELLAAIVDRSLGRAVAAVLDLHLLSSPHAHLLAEVAWHAGWPTILRLEDAEDLLDGVLETHTLAAVAHADVVVSSPEMADAVIASAGSVLCELKREVGSAEVLELLGPLTAPATGPTLTVLVATYDRPEALRACLQSLTTQTLPAHRFDVVVVDDASPVDVAPVVASFAGDLRTTLVRLPVNSGPAVARAAGVATATGEVIMLLDDDDVATPRMLAEHLRLHVERPEEHVTALGHTVVRPGGHPDGLSRHVTRIGRQYFNYASFRAGEVLGWPAFWAGRISAKRSLLTRHSFRGTFMEDTDFAWRADLELSGRGTPLEVHYTRRAVQVMRSDLDLHGMRRRQVKMGWAAQAFESTAGLRIDEFNDGEKSLKALRQRSATNRRVLDELAARSAQPLTAVRLGRRPSASSEVLGRMDGLLRQDLAAHHGSGFLAKSRLDTVLSSGRLPVMALDGRRGDAPFTAAASSPGDPLELLVVVPAEGSWATDFVQRLEALLSAEGRTFDDIGAVEVRTTDDVDREVAEADFLLDPEGLQPYSGRGPVPLLSLTGAEWVARLSRPATVAGSLH